MTPLQRLARDLHGDAERYLSARDATPADPSGPNATTRRRLEATATAYRDAADRVALLITKTDPLTQPRNAAALLAGLRLLAMAYVPDEAGRLKLASDPRTCEIASQSDTVHPLSPAEIDVLALDLFGKTTGGNR